MPSPRSVGSRREKLQWTGRLQGRPQHGAAALPSLRQLQPRRHQLHHRARGTRAAAAGAPAMAGLRGPMHSQRTDRHMRGPRPVGHPSCIPREAQQVPAGPQKGARDMPRLCEVLRLCSRLPARGPSKTHGNDHSGSRERQCDVSYAFAIGGLWLPGFLHPRGEGGELQVAHPVGGQPQLKRHVVLVQGCPQDGPGTMCFLQVVPHRSHRLRRASRAGVGREQGAHGASAVEAARPAHTRTTSYGYHIRGPSAYCIFDGINLRLQQHLHI
mmetsp:Transcript_98867/g.280062  ORF Transcript_98867/g.280062 Transcript_98867/m.280062 type:complete len:270 (-) Transcript_98867:510-1319(-)